MQIRIKHPVQVQLLSYRRRRRQQHQADRLRKVR